jgi:hypothetical protein
MKSIFIKVKVLSPLGEVYNKWINPDDIEFFHHEAEEGDSPTEIHFRNETMMLITETSESLAKKINGERT